jgi:SNF2 family DNA or RNA helicase
MSQAEDRVHRIGQRDAVTAWYLLAAGTIDEDIEALLEAKRAVVDAATDGTEAATGESILNDLIARLEAKNRE